MLIYILLTMTDLYIIAGANGSGKTTFAIEFSRNNDLCFINADEIAQQLNPFDITKASVARVKCSERSLNAIMFSINRFFCRVGRGNPLWLPAQRSGGTPNPPFS
ncbi:hypothetical protein PN36_01395 [Candidatus Thiomargarita nelsonii]|uniref:UDP-N-acetylglucosamine kinase n=1 Tax=Candidatus Thiomargarita nelsonii TaxID=1003181 RepID=A0A0A6P1J7_9GAMM|nr:hypothetical protein PN36_01395 [Candidatus Thiomargarita nelsonii]